MKKLVAVIVAVVALSASSVASAVTVLPGANDRPGNSDCNREAHQPQGVNGLCK